MDEPDRILKVVFDAPTPPITEAPPTPLPTAPLVARSWADPQDCVDDYKDSSSHCYSLQTTVEKCASRLDGAEAKPDNGPFARCFCEPVIYSELVECQNQHRQCLRDFVMDPQFSHYRSQWEGFCKSASPDITFATPSLLTPEPVTSFKNDCSYIKSACNRYNTYTAGCQSSFSDHLSECYCQTHVVIMESICSVDGIAMCSKPPIEDGGSLWGARSCNGAGQGHFTVPEWAFAKATVDVPTTVPFAKFPMTYNDIPTESASVPGLAVREHETSMLLMGICLLIASRWTRW